MIRSGTYSSLVNGVSQQAAPLRFPSQGQLQINGVSSVVRGLYKRPPTAHVASLNATQWTTPKVHFIDRDTNEKYIVVLINGDLKVFGTDGAAKTVNFPDGKAYLAVAGAARTAFRLLTLEDTTFIVNREFTTAMASSPTGGAQVPEALIWVKTAALGHDYTVEVDAYGPVTLSINATTGSPKTTTAANDLGVLVNAAISATHTTVVTDSTIYIKRTNSAAFTIKAHDSYGNQGMSLINGSVQRLSDLPTVAKGGMIVHVLGDPNVVNDDYWVTFVPNSGTSTSFGVGTWQETVAPTVKTTMDAATLPHVLVREADGTFTFKKAPFLLRTVGDTTTNPQPSFIGNTINDVFYFKGRLGFLSQENAIMSRSGSVYDFFRKTAATLLDDDPIDVQSGGSGVSVFYAAVPFQNSLLLFSDRSQHTLSGGDILTNKTVAITLTSSFDSLNYTRPIAVGTSVFFPFPRGDYSGVREYYTNQVTNTSDAEDVTAHVPEYIKGNIYELSSMTAEEFLVALTDDTAVDSPNRLYVYQWKWAGQQKAQSAWHYWVFDAPLAGAGFIRNTLYLVFSRSDGMWLETVDLLQLTQPNTTFRVNLDRQCVPTNISYDADTNITTCRCKYHHAALVAVTPNGTNLDIISNSTASPYTTLVQGGLTTDCWMGIPYGFRYTFTPPFVREQGQGGVSAVTEGRLQVSTIRIQYDRTSDFTVENKPDINSTYYSKFRGRVLGSQDNVVGEMAIENGVFEVPVRCRNEVMNVTLKNDTPGPSFFLSAEWSGTFTPRSQRQ